MHQAAACPVQDQPALHKLRLVLWPDLDLRHSEALRKAAPQLQIVTADMMVLPKKLHTCSALMGTVPAMAPTFQLWMKSRRPWKVIPCLLLGLSSASLSLTPASRPARRLTLGDAIAEPLDQEYAAMLGNFNWSSAGSSAGAVPGAQHVPAYGSSARSTAHALSMAERFRYCSGMHSLCKKGPEPRIQCTWPRFSRQSKRILHSGSASAIVSIL